MQTDRILFTRIRNFLLKYYKEKNINVDGELRLKYMLVFVWMRYVSNIFEKRETELRETYAGKDEFIEKRLRLTGIYVPESASFKKIYEARVSQEPDKKIDIILQSLADENPVLLKNENQKHVFEMITAVKDKSASFPGLTSFLHDFLDLFGAMDDGEEYNEVAADIFDWLLPALARMNNRVAFYTPGKVTETLLAIVDPKKGERVYDPASGAGGLLVGAGKYIGGNNFSLYGQENNFMAWALARMNVLIHHLEFVKLDCQDAISHPFLEEGQLKEFDVVLSRLPFGLLYWNTDDARTDCFHRFDMGIPPVNKPDWAYISHVLASLSAKGRAAVVTQLGALFRKGTEKEIREQVVNRNWLEAVIGLPANLFEDTMVASVILVFNKQKTDRSVLFVDVSAKGENRKCWQTADDHQLETVFRYFREYRTVKPKVEGEWIQDYMYVCDIDEIARKEYNLSLNLYVGTKEDADYLKVEEEIQRLTAELKQVRKEIEVRMKDMGIDPRIY